jgi:hypothetical protein
VEGAGEGWPQNLSFHQWVAFVRTGVRDCMSLSVHEEDGDLVSLPHDDRTAFRVEIG